MEPVASVLREDTTLVCRVRLKNAWMAEPCQSQKEHLQCPRSPSFPQGHDHSPWLSASGQHMCFRAQAPARIPHTSLPPDTAAASQLNSCYPSGFLQFILHEVGRELLKYKNQITTPFSSKSFSGFPMTLKSNSEALLRPS